MKHYDIFVQAGTRNIGIRVMGKQDKYFAGYDFMGSVDWTNNIDEMEKFDTIDEARDIVNNLELSEEWEEEDNE